jgi:prephenate dehydratase
MSFPEAFDALQNEEVEYAIIPLENSTNGSVVQTLDLLADRKSLYQDVQICDEHFLTVHHCLLVGKERDSTPPTKQAVTKLYTHPQAWGQCESFLSRYFTSVERQDVSSTSKAAEIVSKDHSGASAAIASQFAADHYGATVLDANIEDKSNNTTRFLIFQNFASEKTNKPASYAARRNTAGKNVLGDSDDSGKQKALLSFRIDHSSPGALADALLIFKTHGMNLTSISSRPSHVQHWQYIFHVECEWIPSDHVGDVLSRLLLDLRKATEFCRNWGSWEDKLGKVK